MMLCRALALICFISLRAVQSDGDAEKHSGTKSGIKISFSAIYSGSAETFGVNINDADGNTLFTVSFKPPSDPSGPSTALEARGGTELLAAYPNLVDGEEFTVTVVASDGKIVVSFNGEPIPGAEYPYNNDKTESAAAFALWGGAAVGSGQPVVFLTEEKDSFTHVTEHYTYTFASTEAVPGPIDGEEPDGETDVEGPTEATEFTYTFTLPNEATRHPREPCTAGDFMTLKGCVTCPENTFSGDGAHECTSCPDGKIAANGSRSIDDCVYAPCTAGYFMTDDGCEMCPENTFSGEAATSCEPCPKRMESEPGSASCEYPDSCPKNMVGCDNGTKCIENWRLCDASPDCKDGSDESMEQYCSNQPECPPGTLTCADNVTCVSTRGRCDGHQYCPDGSDEDAEFCLGYECPPNQQKCGDNTKCVNKWKLCDGTPECSDGSDEADSFCEVFVCPEAKARCADGLQCASKKKVCAGKTECNDGSLDNPLELDFCKADPCKAGFYMTEDQKCKKCPKDTYSAFGSTSCTSCPSGKVSKPGSVSKAACKYEKNKKPGGGDDGGRGKGRGKGKKGRGPGKEVGTDPDGGSTRRGRGRGTKRWKKNKKTKGDYERPDPDVTTSYPFTSTAAPDIPDEDQKPTCDCWTEECSYCKDLACAVKQEQPKFGQGIHVQITSEIKKGKYNILVLYNEDGEYVGKLKYNRRRIFLSGGCIACPTPPALKKASKDGSATWEISLKNGLLKISNGGELMYKRFLIEECAELYNTVRYFAFAHNSCGSTYSYVESEMEAGEKMTDDCSCVLEE